MTNALLRPLPRIALGILGVLTAAALALAPARAMAVDDFVIDVQPASQTIVDGTPAVLDAYASAAVAERWQQLDQGTGAWTDIPGQTSSIAFIVSAGEYRAVFTDADGIDHPSQAATIAVIRLDWSPAPVEVPEGAELHQHAEVDGDPAATIRWQTATGPFGPWRDLPGQDAADLELSASLDLDGVFLRPVGTSGGIDIPAQFFTQLHVFPTTPALPDEAAADSALAAPNNTVDGVALTGDTLTVSLVPAAAGVFGDDTWFRGVGFSSPTDLGWAKVVNGTLQFDVASLPAGDHLVLVQLPLPGRTSLAASGAARFTIPTRSASGSPTPTPSATPSASGDPAPATDGSTPTDPELASTGVAIVLPLGIAAILIAAGLVIVLRRRRIAGR